MRYCARCWVSQRARRRQADECHPPQIGQGLMPYRRNRWRSARTEVTCTSVIDEHDWITADRVRPDRVELRPLLEDLPLCGVFAVLWPL